MQEQVRKILRRVLNDDDFLNEVLNDPETALRGYDLTDEERSILVNPRRDLIELMRLGGGNAVPGIVVNFLDLVTIALDVDLTQFITTLDIDLFLIITFFPNPRAQISLVDQTAEGEQLRAMRRDQVTSLSAAVRNARAGAERLQRLQELLEVVSGARELAGRSKDQGVGGGGSQKS
jgi:hypothetical protein